MSGKIDLTGQKFGRLTVLEDVGRKNRGVIWRCLCECGTIKDIKSGSLQSGATKSCGCLVKLDLIGQVFGRLTVVEKIKRTKKGERIKWFCRCSCGNETCVVGTDLVSGHTQSCGCYNKERTSETSINNLVGARFGRLLVLREYGRDSRQKLIWLCRCDCGNEKPIYSSNLIEGLVLSCGCYHKEQTSKANSGDRNWNWKGGITPLNNVIRECTRYKEWRKQVFQRDSYTCQHCGDKGGDLIVHHIKLFSIIMEESHITSLEEALQCEALWEVSNGITLCVECHEEEHARLRTLDIPE